ncbi:MAG: thiopurine S-methyltransferase [Pseudomonadota bacterium]
MQASDWLDRWEQNNIGWHQSKVNRRLRDWWHVAPPASVLVPLCGKTLDLLWLFERGHDVTGVELSSLASAAFFEENAIAHTRRTVDSFELFEADSGRLRIYCGDYFEFGGGPFDAVFDRGALVALDADLRPRYAAHTATLLVARPEQLLLTVDYDQSRVAGPPFSVPPDEVLRYWPALGSMLAFNAIEEVPPKFKEGGLTTVTENVWRSP